MSVEPIDYQKKVQDLEKSVRVLQQKLKRSETNKHQLEEINEKKEALLRKLIQELKESEQALEQKSSELEKTLKDLQSVQTKLVESEKMSALGVLVAGIAHEINNPINFIHGNIEYASRYFRDLLDLLALYQQEYAEPVLKVAQKLEEIDLNFLTEDLLKLLTSMKVGCDRIRSIVLGLRIFSRLDQAEFKSANLHEGLDSTLMILQHRLKAFGANPEIQVVKAYGNLPNIECFPGQLNQVFMNILANAIDALRQEESEDKGLEIETDDNLQCKIPVIRIQTEVIDNQAVVQIADNGSGMPEATCTKIFDPFFTTKPVGKGTGLGLSISYQIIVENHGGSLSCQSSLRQGTEFVIKIPIRQKAPPATSTK